MHSLDGGRKAPRAHALVDDGVAAHWVDTASLHTLTCMMRWLTGQYCNGGGDDALITRSVALMWIRRIRRLRAFAPSCVDRAVLRGERVEMDMPVVGLGVMMVHMGLMPREDLETYVHDIMDELGADDTELNVWHLAYLCAHGHAAAAGALIRRGKAQPVDAVAFRLASMKMGLWTCRTGVEDFVTVLRSARAHGVLYSLAVERKLGVDAEPSFARRRQLMSSFGICPDAVRFATHVRGSLVYRIPYLDQGEQLWNVHTAQRLHDFHTRHGQCAVCLKERHGVSTSAMWRALTTAQHDVSAYVVVDTIGAAAAQVATASGLPQTGTAAPATLAATPATLAATSATLAATAAAETASRDADADSQLHGAAERRSRRSYAFVCIAGGKVPARERANSSLGEGHRTQLTLRVPARAAFRARFPARLHTGVAKRCRSTPNAGELMDAEDQTDGGSVADGTHEAPSSGKRARSLRTNESCSEHKYTSCLMRLLSVP